MPNVTPFELLNTIVPLVAVWVPAATAPGAVDIEVRPLCEAVICDEPDMPNVNPFELAKTTVPEVAVWVPAAPAIPPPPPAATLAVTVPALIPKVTPFELASTMVPVAEEVPADRASTRGPLTTCPSFQCDGRISYAGSSGVVAVRE